MSQLLLYPESDDSAQLSQVLESATLMIPQKGISESCHSH